jgi:hypothetical protein
MAISLRTNKERKMPGNPRELIAVAERLFPVRIRIGIPPGGLGQQYSQITDWLDTNCGADSWALTPAGTRGVLNDAISLYFADATLAGAFVARWCVGSKVEPAGGVFQVRGTSQRRGSGRDCIGHPEGSAAIQRETQEREQCLVNDDPGEGSRWARTELIILRTRGTVVGAIMWIAAMAFIFAMITGIVH